jgi:hypothetical protein
MEIYLIGWIVIPISIYLFVFKPNWLYQLTIFFIPFTGTAVFKLNLSSFNAEGIRASLFLGFLCLLRHMITAFFKQKIIYPFSQKNTLNILFLLAFVILISLIMPVIINGNLTIVDPYIQLIYYAKTRPLYFSPQYLTQALYFIFGALISYVVVIQNKTSDDIKQTLRIYLISTFFVSLWGWFEIICYYLNITFPSFLFNQNSVNHEHVKIVYGLPRITSVALEPSIMAQQMVAVLPILFWDLINKNFIMKKNTEKIILVSSILTLALCTSSTAYFGLVLFAIIVLWELFKREKIKYWLFTLVVFISFLAFIATPFVIYELALKLNAYSGIERWNAIVYGWTYFREYPILGIGWGVFPSWDFLICILTGAGIIGLFVFSILLINIFRKYRNQLKIIKEISSNSFPNILTLNLIGKHSLLVMLLISQFSGFIYHSLYFWFILGLSIAIAGLDINKELTQEEKK